MQSKIIKGLLSVLAFTGLGAFAALSIFNSSNTVSVTEDIQVGITKAREDLKVIEANNEKMQGDLIKIKERKAFLEGSILENEKEKGKLDNAILSLQGIKILLKSEIDNLGKERDKLSEIVADLLIEIDNTKELDALQEADERQGYEIKELLLQIDSLQLENKELTANLFEVTENSKEKGKKDKEALVLLETNLVAKEKQIADIKEQFREQTEEMSEQIQSLTSKLNDASNSNVNYTSTPVDNLIPNIADDSSDVIEDKIAALKILETNFQKLNGLRVIFSGNMIYDETRGQIVFRADNSIGIPIFQDDFTGSIAGKCGLPIDKEIENRCSATIIAEFVLENNDLFLRGKEIVEIVKK
tara:strand:+ start:863 stop:1936 length:1074 start_codon:yes stop_codon:yes gene_type:complete